MGKEEKKVIINFENPEGKMVLKIKGKNSVEKAINIERNSRAKEINFHASMKAYDDKDLFLKKALELSREIQYPFFKYGWKEDPFESYHDIVYYFEIENLGQVSFHSNKIHEGTPKFLGEWSGIRNYKFPFNLKTIKKLIKNRKKIS